MSNKHDGPLKNRATETRNADLTEGRDQRDDTLTEQETDPRANAGQKGEGQVGRDRPTCTDTDQPPKGEDSADGNGTLGPHDTVWTASARQSTTGRPIHLNEDCQSLQQAENPYPVAYRHVEGRPICERCQGNVDFVYRGTGDKHECKHCGAVYDEDGGRSRHILESHPETIEVLGDRSTGEPMTDGGIGGGSR